MIRRTSASSHSVWWVDPGNLLFFVTLPIFVASALLGAPLMTEEFKSFNFLTSGMIYLGVLAICILALGAKLGSAIASRSARRPVCFHPPRFDQFLVLVLIVAVASHLLLLGSLLFDFSLIADVFKGETGATFRAKDSMDRLVGVTSLTNVSPLFWSMCATRYVTRGGFFTSKGIAFLALLLALLIFLHAFLGSGRLVVLANGICFMLPLLTFEQRFRRIALFAPLAGIFAVIILFAAGEYTRSWAYHEHAYSSFAEFAGLRLLAYLAVASNTGAGMILTMPPVGYPLLTATWITRLPFVGTGSTSYSNEFLVQFGNREFNNPSGIFAPMVDFGLTIGIIYLFLWGLVLGSLYGSYRRGHPVSMLAFPLFYIGLADLTQIWYWGQPPFIPQLIFLVLAVLTTVRRPIYLRKA